MAAMTTSPVLAVVVLAVAGGFALHAVAQQSGVKRTELQRQDLSIPGREVIQVRVDLDPGVTFPAHSHPGEEIAYVLEGVWEYQIEGKAPVTLKAGEALFIPAGTVHSAKNVGSGVGSELATYIVEKGKPLVVLAAATIEEPRARLKE
jgi:quercetin dioxygenase-like cupin family protein